MVGSWTASSLNFITVNSQIGRLMTLWPRLKRSLDMSIKMPTKKQQPTEAKLTQAYPPKAKSSDDEPEKEKEPEPAPPEPPPEEPKQSACDAVGYGGTCAKCGWTWGDLDPHPVHVVPQNVTVPVEAIVAPPDAPTPPAPDPKACPPVYHQSECPKCGWVASSGNAHPVF